jgi:3-methylfumaryl-CoA hydratase
LFFTPRPRASEIGSDGHARRGGFLPPVPLPRRMWAGGHFEFHAPLRIGDEVTRDSCITDVANKAGRSGELVFVTVRHQIRGGRGPLLTEHHHIVYRDLPRPGDSPPPPRPEPVIPTFSRDIVPDPVLLFRYSALTFNGHRIHYDRDYATRVEGYPGLVVHGPLVATLLLDLLRRERPPARLRHFEFQALRPLFDIHPFTVCGRDEGAHGFALWARDHEGALAMTARATLV